MDTVRDLIGGSLRLIGAIDPGESPDPEETNDALGTFNDFLDALGVERLMLPFTASVQYATIPTQASYSVGPGADWNGIRPQDVITATLRVGNVDVPLTKMSLDQYSDIPVKTTLSPQPQYFYYEAQYPLGRFVLFPIPTVIVGVIITQQALFQQVTLDTVITTLPPGYRRMLRYNLALELAPEYSRATVSAQVRSIAADSKAKIKGANSVSLDASFDSRTPGLGASGRYNIYQDG